MLRVRLNALAVVQLNLSGWEPADGLADLVELEKCPFSGVISMASDAGRP